MVSSPAETVKEYLAALPEERRRTLAELRQLILQHLPAGYVEGMANGMIAYQIPLTRYPDTYNGQPLQVAALAAQKNYLSLYLLCVYSEPAKERALSQAFRQAGKKLDKGKSCIRFRSLEDLPLDAIAAAISGTSVAEFIATYEANRASARADAPARKRRAAKAPSKRTARSAKR